MSTFDPLGTVNYSEIDQAQRPVRRKPKGLLGRALVWVAVGLLGAGVSACNDDDDDITEPEGEGHLVVRIADAPFPYAWVESAMISIDSVGVQFDTSVDEPRWMTISTTPRDINLLTLQNGNSQVLADVDMKVGEVEQVRLHINAASLTLTDDREFDLTIPIEDEDGIEVAVSDVAVESDQTVDLLLDFDVSNSFIPTPSTANDIDDIIRFDFAPQIRVEDLSATGSISGTVYSTNGTATETDDVALSGAAVTILSDTVEIAGTASSSDGTFHMLGLPPGQYQILVTAVGYVSAATTESVERGQENDGNELRLTPIGG